ncbi:MAG: MFS transporter [bacterium]|nr:MFS transporter [bacterium]
MVNRVIKRLVISDFIFNFAFGLLGPIFAVFILNNVQGSSLRVIGLATTFYWISRTLSTVPLSRFMDKTDGERDEYYFSLIGSFIIASVPLFYLLISVPWHLYLIQMIYGLAASMAVPAWRILFTDHLDKGKTGYEWSLEDIAIGVSVGISAYIGSSMAEKFGFRPVLILLSILGYISTIVLIPLFKDAKTLPEIKRAKKLHMIKERRKDPVPPRVDGIK